MRGVFLMILGGLLLLAGLFTFVTSLQKPAYGDLLIGLGGISSAILFMSSGNRLRRKDIKARRAGE